MTTYFGDSYPSPAPNRVFQRAFREGKLEVEPWSLLFLGQRLKAGAMGVPFLPVNSISGSPMEEDNRQNFFRLKNPLAPEETAGLVRSLSPDLKKIPKPEPEETALLRLFDPHKFFGWDPA